MLIVKSAIIDHALICTRVILDLFNFTVALDGLAKHYAHQNMVINIMRAARYLQGWQKRDKFATFIL